MIMIRRKQPAEQPPEQDQPNSIVGVIEIPYDAEAEWLVSGDESAQPAHVFARRAAAPLPPATIIRVDLVNLLDDLEAELRRFHDQARCR